MYHYLRSAISAARAKYALSSRLRLNRLTAARAAQSQSIRVAFIVLHDATWKLGPLFDDMHRHPRFNPQVYLCPDTHTGSPNDTQSILATSQRLQARGQVHCLSLDTDGSWKDIRKSFDPHIVFFTNPWPITLPMYQIDAFPHSLACYLPYSWDVAATPEVHYDTNFHRSLWRFYLPSHFHRIDALKQRPSLNKAIRVVGYPPLDVSAQKLAPSPTKSNQNPVVIWAPHHTIPGDGGWLNWSTFLRYSGFMLRLAHSRRDTLTLVFKPHPLLKSKLSKPAMWGATQTDDYWKAWSELGPGFLCEGDYSDLFVHSDGLIHDCGSFIAEYIATGKPSMFLLHSPDLKPQLNIPGRTALDAHYLGYSEADVLGFIDHVVCGHSDTLSEVRSTAKQQLFPAITSSSTELILRDICLSLGI